LSFQMTHQLLIKVGILCIVIIHVFAFNIQPILPFIIMNNSIKIHY
jgi:hypothetical protein